MNRRMTGVLVLLVCFALVATLGAQVIKGSISGTVVDPQGAVIAGADVKAMNMENTAFTYTTKTNSSGFFAFNLIPTGTYKIEITHGKNYKTLVRNNVLVSAGADAGLGEMQMQMGSVETTLEVKAEAPLITTSEAQVTNTFSGTTLTSFAGAQENQGLDNMVLFIPGVVAARDNGFSNTNGGSGFSVNGLRGRNNDQQVDGTNNNDNSVGGPGLAMTDSEFVSQYVVTTNNFGPQYGRNSGSVVNVLTKAGGNTWHGSIYGTENNSILNSLFTDDKDPRICGDNCLKKPNRMNDEFAGFTVGGPFIKNKLFFFGGFDEEIVSRSNTFRSGTFTPTPAGLATLAACFPGSSGLAALVTTGPYAISAGNPHPIASSIETVSVGACANVEQSLIERTVPQPVHIFNWLMRTDLQLTNDTIVGRYIFGRGNYFNLGDNGAAGYFYNQPALSQTALLGWTHSFGSRMVNEARISFNRLNVEFGGGSLTGAFEPSANNLDQAMTGVLFSSAANQLGWGPANNLPQQRIVSTWQFQDNWSMAVGKHMLKAGVNWTYQRSPNIFLPYINGQYRFSSLSRLMSDVPNRVRISNGPSLLDFREYDTFLYFGDDWKIKPNLTLQAGITWSYYGQPANLFNDLTTKRESNAATAFWASTEPTGTDALGNTFINPGEAIPLSDRTFPQIPTVKTSFGPSLGFAYSPGWGGWLTGHGNTVIRGGYRLAWDPPFYNIYLNIASSAPVVFLDAVCTSNTACSGAGVTMPALPTGPNVRSSLSPFIALGAYDPRELLQTQVTPHFGPDMVHSWSFGLERRLGNNMAFEARYVGNAGRHLFQTLDGNPMIGPLQADFPNLVPSGLTPCTTPLFTNAGAPWAGNDQFGRVNCNAAPVERVRANSAFSNYNGLQTEFRVNNLFKQLTLRSSYTWSKNLDNVSEIFATGGAGNTSFYAQNPANQIKFPGEYSISGLDIPHQWSMMFNEDLPFFRDQKGAIGHVLGGWSLSGTYLIASGQPYTPAQYFEAYYTQPNDYYDYGYISAYAGTDTAYPFWGNKNAPSTAVGIFAGDACVAYSLTGTDAICTISPTQLVSLNAIGASGCESNDLIPCPAVTTTNNDVRFIVNGATAAGIFGTPFGNVARNPVRDAMMATGNFTIGKKVKLSERVSFNFHMTMMNVFNQTNFVSVDPYISDAGFQGSYNGFGDPSLTSSNGYNGTRTIIFGGKLTF
jgi:carboxypeptidase family protein